MNTKRLNGKNRNMLVGMALFAVLLLAFSAAVFYLYFKQSVSAVFYMPEWESDIGAYIQNMKELEDGKVFSYPILFIVQKNIYIILLHLFKMCKVIFKKETTEKE